MINYLLFDVDNTLYPASSGLLEAVDHQINAFMVDRLRLDLETVNRLRIRYRRRYGTTLQGLVEHDRMAPEAYLKEVHRVPVEQFLHPDPILDAVLSDIPMDKAVFTNGPAEYSTRILDALGIEHHFTSIFDIRFLNYVGKPDPKAYQSVLNALHVQPDECVFIEDSVRNLRTAKKLGMGTILVREDGAEAGWVDAVIRTVHEVGQTLDDLGQRLHPSERNPGQKGCKRDEYRP